MLMTREARCPRVSRIPPRAETASAAGGLSMHSRSHPFVWWRTRRGGGECGTGASPSAEDWHPWSMPEGEDFGVRRPLRFLAYRLGLDERQVSELAIILNELKTERAQAAVD